MEGCYIPNNPHYGLVELPGTGGGSSSAIFGGTYSGNCGTGSVQVPTDLGTPVGTSAGSSGVYWSTEDMGSFSLPPLDLDPLPSLFPFSPCSAASYKTEFPVLKEKQPHDMADVLLSLKHAVVHPGQTGGQLSPCSNFAGAYNTGQQCAGQASYHQGPSASLSYTVHPHQMMSPSGGYGTAQYCTGTQDQGGVFGTGTTMNAQTPGQHGATMHSQHHNMFPSMSVNVSMNMTMHGYPTNMTDNLQHQMTCPQMQWAPAPPNPSPVYPQTQGLLSPQTYAGGATYSFTADFRPPTVVAEPPLITTNSSFKPVISKVTSYAPVSTAPGVTPVARNSSNSRRNGNTYQNKVVNGNTYHQNKMVAAAAAAAAAMTSVNSDESQRPNLCRICGKTYARPSTLKTHLRTHSGEKPYRCGDCNKSFSQAANLTAHVRTHSGEKPFRCPICDRRFSQSSSVTTHMRTHSGERPYRCRLCKKAFSDSSTLTKHLRIHSGEKPYQCKLCLLRFSQSGNLNRHMRVHGGTGNGLPA